MGEDIFEVGYEGTLEKVKQYAVENDVLAVDEDGRTLLHWSVSAGHFDVCQYLVQQHHLSLALGDGQGWTPLLISVSSGHDQMSQWIIGQDPSRLKDKNQSGMTVMHYVCSKARLQLLGWLLQEHPSSLSFRTKDKFGYTPLHRLLVATREEEEMKAVREMLKMIMEKLSTTTIKDLVDAKDKNGDNLLDILLDHEDVSFLSYCLSFLPKICLTKSEIKKLLTKYPVQHPITQVMVPFIEQKVEKLDD